MSPRDSVIGVGPQFVNGIFILPRKSVCTIAGPPQSKGKAVHRTFAIAVAPAVLLLAKSATVLSCTTFCVWGGIIIFLSNANEAVLPAVPLKIVAFSVAKWDSKINDLRFAKYVNPNFEIMSIPRMPR